MDLPIAPSSHVGLILAGAMSMHSGDKVAFVDGFTIDELLQRARNISDIAVQAEFIRLIRQYSSQNPGVPVSSDSTVKELVVTYKPAASANQRIASTKQGATTSGGKKNHWANRIIAAADEIGLDPEFAVLVARKESGLNPSAKSPTGAGGLFQLTSVAIADVARVFPISGDKRMDAEWNIFVGVRYLSMCAGYAGVPSGARSRLSSDARVATYACFNVGVGTYRKLVRGIVDPQVIVAVNQQAKELRRDGAEGYLSNVLGWLSA